MSIKKGTNDFSLKSEEVGLTSGEVQEHHIIREVHEETGIPTESKYGKDEKPVLMATLNNNTNKENMGTLIENLSESGKEKFFDILSTNNALTSKV